MARARVGRIQAIPANRAAGRRKGWCGESAIPFWITPEVEAGLCASVGEVCGAISLAEIRWKLPLLTVGFWAAVARRRKGDTLVGRRAATVQVMERLRVLMDTRLEEYKANARA